MDLYDVRFRNKSTITVAGPSQAGKSTLVENIVENRDIMFCEPIPHVYWYCDHTPTKRLAGVSYMTGIPTNIRDSVTPHSLVIVDDYMKENANSSEFTNLFTKDVHHLPMTLIYITQNIFNKSVDSKTRRMNTNYIITFKNPHDRMQIEYIGREMYPRDKKFLVSAYEHATSKAAYSYLLIDCRQETPDEIRVRTNITKDEIMSVYVPLSVNILT